METWLTRSTLRSCSGYIFLNSSSCCFKESKRCLYLKIPYRYFYTEIDKQIQVTQFINLWMKYRVPHLKNLNNGLSTGKKGDPVYAEIGFWKELEILEMIFNSDNEIYNFRVSKNSPDVEERLFRIYESLGSPIESVTGKNALTNDVVIQGEN